MKIDRRDFLVATSSALLASTVVSGSPSVSLPEGSVERPRHVPGGKISVYTTAKDTDQRLGRTAEVEFKPMGQPLETQTCVFIDPRRTFQTFLGIGGAITDSSAETLAKIPAAKQQELIDAYFDPDKGIGYTLARTNIHSCDFSSASYTYVAEGDKELKTFNVEHDRKYRIPMIKRAMAAAQGKMKLYGSPWSPPAFMKDSNNMLRGGKLKPDHYQAWANYFTKFVKEYEKEGIPIWGISIQNEPMATQKWESCIFTGEEERDFLKNNLGPTMQKAGLGDKKIIFWDHNRDLIYQRASTMLSDAEAAKYVWGIGYHWYEPWSGGEMMFDNVKLVNETFPDKNLIFTEGCADSYDPSKVNDWTLGERYGRSMIHDFNNGTVGWTDWNVLLDEKGGPNHVQNFCFAPIHADTRTGELTYTSSYYYIGHFSKFIKPGAKRIATSASRSSLISTAFVNPDGKVAAIVMNRGDKSVDYHLWLSGDGAEVTSPAHSIQTLVF